jgi:hypothetical protein
MYYRSTGRYWHDTLHNSCDSVRCFDDKQNIKINGFVMTVTD